MFRSIAKTTLLISLTWFSVACFSQENLEGFRHLSDVAIPETADQFGAVPTGKISLTNLAPVLLPYLNNGPTFGTPGTDAGDLWHRTQLSGDWGGSRTDLARRGFFFDMYSTTVYQNVTDGGLETGDSLVQGVQYTVNIDTARAGWWSGGLIHFTAQSRYGDPPARTFNAGTVYPQYMGLVHPTPLNANDTLPTEFVVIQAVSKKFVLMAGKISDIFVPDQTLFASSYKYHFANFNFLKNPMTVNFYNPTAWAGLGAWIPSKHVVIAGGVLDPNSESTNFAKDAFDKVNIYLMGIISYQPHGLPGSIGPAFNWSNKPKIDLTNPFVQVTPQQIPQAIGSLIGAASPSGLAANTKDNSWFLITNASQYLYVKDDRKSTAQKMRSGQLLNGIGIIGRAGYAPDDSNRISADGSIAGFAHGLWSKRPNDSFGGGFYYNKVSDPLKNTLRLLSANAVKAEDEKGTEVFYDFALTPAIRVIPGYQHIWNPLVAKVAKNQDSADLFTLRINVAW